jgi:hypothetical protein
MPAKTRFCQLCASEEGFNTLGSQPNRKHNPGDLRHSPHSSHAGEDPNAIGIIDNVDDGWADFERQARLWASRGLTLQEAIFEEAPPGGTDGNNTGAYLAFVVEGFNGAVVVQTPMTEVLLIPAI